MTEHQVNLFRDEEDGGGWGWECRTCLTERYDLTQYEAAQETNGHRLSAARKAEDGRL